jgi:hypothetical protein
LDTYTEGVNPENALAYYIIGLTVAVKWSAVDAPLNHLIINLGQITFSSWFLRLLEPGSQQFSSRL